jgi:hypothetical protein
VGSYGPLDRVLLAAHTKATLALLKTAAAPRLTPGSRQTPRRATQTLNESKPSRPWEIRADDTPQPWDD